MTNNIDKVIKASLTFYETDYNLLKAINNNNVSEANRFIINDWKRLKNMEEWTKNFMKIMVGVLVLVISFFIPPLDPIGMGLTTFGSMFIGLTIFKIVVDWRKKHV